MFIATKQETTGADLERAELEERQERAELLEGVSEVQLWAMEIAAVEAKGLSPPGWRDSRIPLRPRPFSLSRERSEGTLFNEALSAAKTIFARNPDSIDVALTKYTAIRDFRREVFERLGPPEAEPVAEAEQSRPALSVVAEPTTSAPAKDRFAWERALDAVRLTQAETGVALAIATFANRSSGWRVRASYEAIARRAHCDRKTVRRALPKLKDAGVLEWIAGHTGVTNVYTLLIPPK